MIGIALPLALIGVGFIIYLLFAAASYALPLFAGVSAAFAAWHAGVPGIAAMLLGLAAFMLVIAAARMATLLLPSASARVALTLLFAIPAAIAGYQVASALLHLSSAGAWSILIALATAALVGVAAAKRLGAASPA